MKLWRTFLLMAALAALAAAQNYTADVLALILRQGMATVAAGLAVSAALNVTESPYSDGFRLEVTLIVVVTEFTTSVTAAEVEPASVAVPAYVAVRLCDPIMSVEAVQAAL